MQPARPQDRLLWERVDSSGSPNPLPQALSSMVGDQPLRRLHTG